MYMFEGLRTVDEEGQLPLFPYAKSVNLEYLKKVKVIIDAQIKEEESE